MEQVDNGDSAFDSVYVNINRRQRFEKQKKKKKKKKKIKYDPQYLKSGVAVSNWISNPAVGLSFKGLSTTGPSC